MSVDVSISRDSSRILERQRDVICRAERQKERETEREIEREREKGRERKRERVRERERDRERERERCIHFLSTLLDLFAIGRRFY